MVTNTPQHLWAISIVSHGHGRAVLGALQDLAAQAPAGRTQYFLTLNAGEATDFLDELPPKVREALVVIRNARPLSFGANHNQALLEADADHVVMVDPDLRLGAETLEEVLRALQEPEIGIVSPLAYTPDGRMEDNGRPLITPAALFRRYSVERWRRPAEADAASTEEIPVDWVAGLFMAMRHETFARLGGFDARYRLYCEDTDLCLRARAQEGLRVALLPRARITHPARRQTLKHPRHLIWHVQGLLRLWRSPAYRQLRGA